MEGSQQTRGVSCMSTENRQGVSCMYAASHKFPLLDIHETNTRAAPSCSVAEDVQLQYNQQEQWKPDA